MKLKELAENVVIRSDIIDVMAWNEEKEDYDNILGYYEVDDLSVFFKNLKEEEATYLDYEVCSIEPWIDCGKVILRIEIEKPSDCYKSVRELSASDLNKLRVSLFWGSVDIANCTEEQQKMVEKAESPKDIPDEIVFSAFAGYVFSEEDLEGI